LVFKWSHCKTIFPFQCCESRIVVKSSLFKFRSAAMLFDDTALNLGNFAFAKWNSSKLKFTNLFVLSFSCYPTHFLCQVFLTTNQLLIYSC
jgi:hypothetical protein